jgi:hypothetical protein
MGQETLVVDHVVHGEKLIRELNAQHIPIDAAAWIKPADEDRWRLCLACDLVNQDLAKAYRSVNQVIRSFPAPFWVEPTDIRLIAPDDSIAKAIGDLFKNANDATPIRFGGSFLGSQAIDQAHIYPPNTTSGLPVAN